MIRSFRRTLAALLLSTTILTASGGPAQAGPALAAIATFMATPLGGIVSTALGSFVSSFLGTLWEEVSKQWTPVSGQTLTMATGGVVPKGFGLGTQVYAGSLNYRGSWGTANGAPNAYYVEEIILGDKGMGELTGLCEDGTWLTIDFAHPHADGRGWPITEKKRGDVDHMWVSWRDGSQVAADPYLRAKFGTDPDFPYEADMIGHGRTVVVVTRRLPTEANKELADVGELRFETSGIPLYNIALDTTAGGSGPHRIDDEATWEPSNNLAVQMFAVVKGIGDHNGDWLYGPKAQDASALPASSWIAAINACDAAVDLAGGGTEPAYHGGLYVSVDAEPASILETLLKAGGGRMAEIGGIYKPMVGAPGAAVFNFTDKTIIASREAGYEPFPRPDDTFNGIRSQFRSRDAGYELVEAPARIDVEQVALDGQDRVAEIVYEAVYSNSQAQRLDKQAELEHRQWRSHSSTLPPIGSELEPLDVVSWTSDLYGYAGKDLLITELEDEPDYFATIYMRELDPGAVDWDPDTEEQAHSVGLLSPYVPPTATIADWDVEGGTIYDTAGNPRRPAALFTWFAGVEDCRAIGVQVATSADEADIVFQDSTDQVTTGSQLFSAQAILPDQELYGRLRYFPNSSGWRSDWTAWRAFTTPALGIETEDFGASMQAWRAYTDVRLNSLTEEVQLFTALAAGQDAANYTDRLYLLDEQRIGDASTYAASTRALLLALGVDGSALADSIDAIEAAAGDVTAGVIWRMTAQASPGDGWARLALEVRAGLGEVWTITGIYLDSKADGTSRIVLKAAETVVVDNADNILALFKAAGGYLNVDRIEALDIVTDKLANNAVSFTTAAFTRGSILLRGGGGANNSVDVVVQSTSFTTDEAGQVSVEGSFVTYLSGIPSNWYVQIEIVRDGAVIHYSIQKIDLNWETGHGFNVAFVDTVAAGVYDYDLVVSSNYNRAGKSQLPSSGDIIDVQERYLKPSILKK